MIAIDGVKILISIFGIDLIQCEFLITLHDNNSSRLEVEAFFETKERGTLTKWLFFLGIFIKFSP